MNMRTDVFRNLPSPFAAQIVFKKDHLYQQKWEKWTFRSDQITLPDAEPDVQYLALENLVLKEFRGTYVLASIFDNRPKGYVDPGQKINPLVLQISYNRIWKDNRSDLDLSFLKPTICQNFAEKIASSFADPAHVPQCDLTKALQQYKNSLQQRL